MRKSLLVDQKQCFPWKYIYLVLRVEKTRQSLVSSKRKASTTSHIKKVQRQSSGMKAAHWELWRNIQQKHSQHSKQTNCYPKKKLKAVNSNSGLQGDPWPAVADRQCSAAVGPNTKVHCMLQA